MTGDETRFVVTAARVYAVSRMAIGIWLLVDPDGFGGKWMATRRTRSSAALASAPTAAPTWPLASEPC